MGDGFDGYNGWRRNKSKGERSEYSGAGESRGRKEDRGNPRREQMTERWNPLLIFIFFYLICSNILSMGTMEATKGGDSFVMANVDPGTKSGKKTAWKLTGEGRGIHPSRWLQNCPSPQNNETGLVRFNWTIIASFFIRNCVFFCFVFREERRYGFEAGYASNMGPWGPSESAVNLPANNSGYGGTSTSRYYGSILLVCK